MIACKFVLTSVVLAACLRSGYAVLVNIDPSTCVNEYYLGKWDVQRFGPLSICKGGTVTFTWVGMHGVFQIPTIACPSNFTAGQTDDYQFLAAASNGGQYVWQTPNQTGHYWVTSQYQDDCRNGMIAEVYVVSPGDKVFTAGSLRASARAALLLAVTAATAMFVP